MGQQMTTPRMASPTSSQKRQGRVPPRQTCGLVASGAVRQGAPQFMALSSSSLGKWAQCCVGFCPCRFSGNTCPERGHAVSSCDCSLLLFCHFASAVYGSFLSYAHIWGCFTFSANVTSSPWAASLSPGKALSF